MKKKLLLHSCCAPCAIYPFNLLKNKYELHFYFFNPNIFPLEEHDRRLSELIRYSKKSGLNLHYDEEEHARWLSYINGYEGEPERGVRCKLCFEYRLKRTYEYALKKSFDYFASVMSISPHKRQDDINTIGEEIALSGGVRYFPSNFKKNDGFKKAALLSKEEGFYRQNYCGCEFSMR